MWRYLAEREDGEDPDAPLFLGSSIEHSIGMLFGRSLIHLKPKLASRNAIPTDLAIRSRSLICVPAEIFFALKALLGHGSLDMVEHYARIAEVDIEQAHRKASPADNWRL